jgi:DNA-directed RNA polymerase specialized sigma subunit
MPTVTPNRVRAADVPDCFPDDLAEYLPLVQNMASGMFWRLGRKFEFEELYGDGCLGLVNAAKAWRQEGAFRPFAIKVIQREMIAGVRRNSMEWEMFRKGVRTKTFSLDVPVEVGSDETHADRLADERGYNVHQRILFRELMAVVGTTRKIDQERVAEMLIDYSPAEVRAQGVLERNRIRGCRHLTIKKLRVAPRAGGVD